MNKVKDLVIEFTSQTFGTEIPDGLCFSTCFPISIILDIKDVSNKISCGAVSKNNSTVTHFWLTLEDDIILDPTIRQFDPNMESTYIGKLTDNEVSKMYVPEKSTSKEWFGSSFNVWKEPLIDKKPRTFQRQSGFEDKMNIFNIRTASVLYSYISKMETNYKILESFKCNQYFSPIIKFLKDRSETDNNFILKIKNEMPIGFNSLFSIALSK